jgi:hypothetical protein
MSAEVKNLEAICAAIDSHKESCEWPATEVRMNPFEVERLGWDEIKGLPVKGDASMQSGRFRVVCANEHAHKPDRSREALVT